MEQDPKAGGQPVAIRDLRFDVERHRVSPKLLSAHTLLTVTSSTLGVRVHRDDKGVEHPRDRQHSKHLAAWSQKRQRCTHLLSETIRERKHSESGCVHEGNPFQVQHQRTVEGQGAVHGVFQLRGRGDVDLADRAEYECATSCVLGEVEPEQVRVHAPPTADMPMQSAHIYGCGVPRKGNTASKSSWGFTP